MLGLEKRPHREEGYSRASSLDSGNFTPIGGTNHLAHVINEAKEVVLEMASGALIPFNRQGDTHSATNTKRCETFLGILTFHLMEQRDQNTAS